MDDGFLCTWLFDSSVGLSQDCIFPRQYICSLDCGARRVCSARIGYIAGSPRSAVGRARAQFSLVTVITDRLFVSRKWKRLVNCEQTFYTATEGQFGSKKNKR